MKVTERKLSDGHIRLEAAASPAEVNHAFTVAQHLVLQDLGVRVPAGKTAQEAAQEKLGIRDLDSMAAPKAAAYLVPFAIDKRNIMPAYMPTEPPAGSIQRGKPFEFSVTVLPKPTYELEDYSPVSITLPSTEVPDEVVDEQMQQLAEAHASFVSVESHPVGKDDCMLLAMDATQDGKPLPALRTEGRTYIMGMQLMPDEFEQNLLGMQAGDTRTFSVDVPAEEGKPGEPIEFTVTVKELQEKKVPVIDDAWVKEHLPMLPNAQAVRDNIRETLHQQAGQQLEQMKLQAAAVEIAKRFKGRIPDAIHEATQKAVVENARMAAQMQGMTFEQLVEQTGGQQGFFMMVALQARETLVQGYALDAVFRHEKLKVTDADVMETCRSINPQNPQAACREMEDNGRGFALREACERYVANKWLAAHANVTVQE